MCLIFLLYVNYENTSLKIHTKPQVKYAFKEIKTPHQWVIFLRNFFLGDHVFWRLTRRLHIRVNEPLTKNCHPLSFWFVPLYSEHSLACDQLVVGHRRSDVTDGVKNLVGRNQSSSLSHDAAADGSEHFTHALWVHVDAVSGYSLQLVQSPSSVSQSTAGDHGHLGITCSASYMTIRPTDWLSSNT